MLTTPQPQRTPSRLEKLVRITWVIPGIVALIVAGIFYVRWSEGQRLRDKQEQEQRARESEENRRAFESLGGNRFEILHFYAQPAVIRRGEAATLCYGVSNAKTVKIEPAEAGVWPSPNRCFEIKPRRDTTYTLTVEDAGGQTKTSSFVLQVR